MSGKLKTATGSSRYGITGADADTDIRELENSEIRRIDQHIISAECGYQILLTKICDGGGISYILKNFIPNISALNRKHSTH